MIRQAKKQLSPDAVESRFHLDRKEIAVIVLTVLLAGTFYGLGRYMELSIPGPFDSGSFAYSAEHVLRGAKIGVDEMPSARTGTLLMNMLGVAIFGFDDFGPKLVQGLLQLAALILLFISLRKAFGSIAAMISVTVASFFLAAPLIAKYGNVKEQYMIAFMAIGISCVILRHLGGPWWWSLLAGAFAAWGPLFKETGLSAIAAIGLFVIVQPLLKNRTWKQTGVDLGLLLGGGLISLAPVFLWFVIADVRMAMPYQALLRILGKLFGAGHAAGGGGGSYVTKGRQTWDLAKQAPVVLRYYRVLILPIALALGAMIVRMIRGVFQIRGKLQTKTNADRFVILLAIWWVLDMAFVWISPRSYEQYYLPLTASGAALGGYLIWAYTSSFAASRKKPLWAGIGAIGVICMIAMAWQVWFGLDHTLHWGTKYSEDGSIKRRGYVQRLEDVQNRKMQGFGWSWEVVAKHIREHSQGDDRIYVWGWIPGVYVKAGRLSSASRASVGNMHVDAPASLRRHVQKMLEDFEKNPPAFLVDTRKNHFPWDRPPLELWPQIPKGFLGARQGMFLPNDPRWIEAYETAWTKYLREKVDPAEAERFQALAPLREYIRENYEIVRGNFGPHVLIKRKPQTPS